MGQRAEAEQVDLEQAERLHVVLVPLDHGAPLHGGVLDRHQRGHRLAAEQKAAGMDRQVAREVADLAGEGEQEMVGRVPGVEARLPERVLQRLREVAVMVGDEPRHPVQGGGRQPEGLAHVADRRPGPVADHVGHHRGALAAILAVHELDRLLAAPVADVEVDVGRLGALPGQEALEQQVHVHRVDGGDAQAVAHRRVGGRAAPLAQDLALAAEADDFVHGQEVAAVVEILDYLQLGAKLPRYGRRRAPAVALARPGEGEPAQPLRRGVAVRQPLRGIAVAHLAQREGAAGGDLVGGRHQLRAVGEQACERRRCLEAVLAVGAQQRARSGQGGAVADAGDHVLQRAPLAVVVEHLGGGRQRHPEAAAAGGEPVLDGGVAGQPVAGDQAVEAARKRLPELHRALPPVLGPGAAAIAGGGQQAAALPQRDQAAGVVGRLLPAYPALPLGTAQPPARDEPAQVGVAGAVLHQQDEGGGGGIAIVGAVGDGDLRADDQARTGAAGGDVGAHDPIDAVPVGQHQRGNAQFPGALHQLFGVAGPLQEREVALAPQRHVAHRRYPFTPPSPAGTSAGRGGRSRSTPRRRRRH